MDGVYLCVCVFIRLCVCVCVCVCVGGMSLLISFTLGTVLSYRHKQPSLTCCKPLSKRRQLQSVPPEGLRAKERGIQTETGKKKMVETWRTHHRGKREENIERWKKTNEGGNIKRRQRISAEKPVSENHQGREWSE